MPGLGVDPVPVEKLDMLPFLDPTVPASSTLLSRKPAHKSDRDSPLAPVAVDSEKNSVFSAGELGVR